MNNLELIDAYLRDELSASQKSSFEQEMASDPSLKGEFEFQSNVVEGIKEARKNQLKAMLNQVPVGGSVTYGVTIGKIATTLIVAGLIGWGIFYFNQSSEDQTLLPVAQESESIDELINEPPVETEEESEDVAENLVEEEKEQLKETVVNKSSSNQDEIQEKETTAPTINKPEAIAGFDSDTDAADSLLAPGSSRIQGEKEEISSIDVKVDNTRKKFTFHYQFKNGRLFLYGDFSSDLYEILEFNADEEKSVFLFYKGKFYDLNSNNERINELKTVKSKTLITKLEQARAGN